ncbi:MAG: hypothetical protein VB039_03485 [Oscillospiraceae bacterium]|nr:hypothetical protein [Oscillospiraceae bacterium]
MDKQLTVNVDADIYDKFFLALNLSEQSQDEAAESCLRWYIAKTFENASQVYNPKKRHNEPKDYRGKAAQRIPTWAMKPKQYNHKIIRAFFEAEDIAGIVTLTMLEQLCSDQAHPELYVPTFKNNYSQMKIDGPKSHGKVFEDDGENVWSWTEIKEVLMKYKSSFYVRGGRR